MLVEYPGRAARVACAERTRAELIEYRPKRPLALRDELRLRVQQARCSTCGACPMIIRALDVMAPAKPEPVSAQIFRLAG